jgi:peptidoglycan-N-acetylglucosamine deacetylase
LLAGKPEELQPKHAQTRINLEALKQEAIPAATPVPPALRGSIRSVELPAGLKLIALTFDLCETESLIAGYDGRIVDVLRAHNVKATFFAGGKWMETHPERAEQLLGDPLFEIGSHSWRHLDPLRATQQQLGEELSLTEAAYGRARQGLVIGPYCPNGFTLPPERMRLFRFPYGRCNAQNLTQVADAGFVSIQWDVVTGDPDPNRSAKAIAATILTNAHPGAIVVAHANGRGRHTAEALETVIPKLKAEGYSFVTVSELIAAGKPVIAEACYQNRKGDNAHLARTSRQGDSHEFWSILQRLN